MNYILGTFLILCICSCGVPRTGILIPEGEVFHHYNYGIGISDVMINGKTYKTGWNALPPGNTIITFRVGAAKLSADVNIADGTRYVLSCDQMGYGSAAIMSCKVLEYKE